MKIPIYFHRDQLQFQPKYEWVLGKKIKHPETTQRAQNIFRTLKQNPDLFEIIETPDVPMSSLRQAHNYQLVTLYNTAMSLQEGETFHPCVFPVRKSANPDPTNINHAGYYCFDSGTPLSRNTWKAASWSAASAYHAAKHVFSGKAQVSYSLSRPPGHHANRDSFGGYCYFNNAGIATRLLRKKGRVAILDIDFHHGNGTQDMFYESDKVLTISIHGDPKKHFPYFAGFSDEIGRGAGKGFNLNYILPDGTKIDSYMKLLKKDVLPVLRNFEPDFLVICAGFDTYELDPIGAFKLKTADYFTIGKELSSLATPTVVVQEGGYYTPDLGKNVAEFLKGFCVK